MPGLRPGPGAGPRAGDRQQAGAGKHRGRQGRPGHRRPAMGRGEDGPAGDHGEGGTAADLRGDAGPRVRGPVPAGHGEGLWADVVSSAMQGAADGPGKGLHRDGKGQAGGACWKKPVEFLFWQ